MDVITKAIIAALAALSKDAVERLENKPKSKGRKATLQEEIESSKVNDDSDIVQLAQDLLNKLEDKPVKQEIINQNQFNTESRNIVSGDINNSSIAAL